VMATRRIFYIQKSAVSNRFWVWKKLPIWALTVLAFCSAASAQKSLVPAIEVFGGYSHLSLSTNQLGLENWTQMNGFDVAVTLPHIYKGLGITADASGNYAVTIEQYNYFIGPQYRWEFNHFQFVAHWLYGRAQTRIRQAGSTFTEPSDRQRSVALGGEIDVPLGNRISIRAVQADYVAASAFGANRNGLRLSTGLVVSFGKH